MSRILCAAVMGGLTLPASGFATRSAEAQVPPMVAACYLPDAQGCLLLNSYECDDRHGRWDMGGQCPAATTDPNQQGAGAGQRRP